MAESPTLNEEIHEARLCLITPARNEADHLPRVADALSRVALASQLVAWIIVDDGSDDGTSEVAATLQVGFPVVTIAKSNDGGLRGGSAFTSFFFGADFALETYPQITHVMKLDADVLLSYDFFSKIAERGWGDLTGGVAIGKEDREQTDLVPGFCKIYSRRAYEVVRNLKPAIGLDVIDATALRLHGFSATVVPTAHLQLLRTIGYSEGIRRGRQRNGIVSRWVGYDHVYFALRILRYLFRPPYVLGAFLMVRSYLSAGPSPYPQELRTAFRSNQRRKLRRLLARPMSGLNELYSPGECDDPSCPCKSSLTTAS